jgi:adenylate cyclase
MSVKVRKSYFPDLGGVMWAKLRQQIWQRRGVWMTAPTVAGIVIGLRLFGWLQPWEWAALDQYFRWRPPEPTDERIVIVGISEADLKKVGQWPMPDAVLAQLLEKINLQKPRAIGLDLYRDLPVEPGHSALVKVFETTPNLIGIEKINEQDKNSAIAPPPVLDKLGQVGVNNLVVDSDGKLRRGLLSDVKNGQSMPSLSFLLAGIYLEAQNILPEPSQTNPKIIQWGKAVFQPFRANDGGYADADDGGYQFLLNYRGHSKSFRTVSMIDVLENRIPADWARDRIVLIGATATSLNDFFYTPYSSDRITTLERTPGVEIQANVISHILSSVLEGRSSIKTWSEPVEGLWIFLWSCVGAALCWKLRDAGGVAKLLPGSTVASLLLAGTGLVGSSYLAFRFGGWWIPVVPPALALFGSATALTSYIASIEREERQTVMNLFGRHVTAQIAEAIWRDRDQLLKEGRLRGRKMTATVLFTDLKGFSTVTEQIDPETLMAWLNEYMDAMAGLVLAHGGVVDKFIGDAVMAVFGVPIKRTTPDAIVKDAVAAVNCALAMADRLEALNQQWHKQGRPQTAMRVGIATGPVVTGSLGSSQRLDYTTLGDSVNVAARLESYDKSLDGGVCRILINEETYQYLQDRFPTQLIGRVLLKGREQPTLVYQVLRSCRISGGESRTLQGNSENSVSVNDPEGSVSVKDNDSDSVSEAGQSPAAMRGTSRNEVRSV